MDHKNAIWKRPAIFAIALAAWLVTSSVSWATPITHNYGDLPGLSIKYLGVIETDTPGPGPYLGIPVSPPGSDMLAFNPLANGFAVNSANGGNDELDAGLTVAKIQTLTEGAQIEPFLNIHEGGVWSVNGAVGTAAARALLVAEPLLITMLNDSVPVSIPVFPTVSFTFSLAPGGSATATSNSLGIAFQSDGSLLGGSGTWNALASYNLGVALAASGHPGSRITELSLFAIDNQLQAATAVGGTASIDKKVFNVMAADAVAEPGTVTLLLLGGVAAVPFRYWKRRQRSAGSPS